MQRVDLQPLRVFDDVQCIGCVMPTRPWWQSAVLIQGPGPGSTMSLWSAGSARRDFAGPPFADGQRGVPASEVRGGRCACDGAAARTQRMCGMHSTSSRIPGPLQRRRSCQTVPDAAGG